MGLQWRVPLAGYSLALLVGFAAVVACGGSKFASTGSSAAGASAGGSAGSSGAGMGNTSGNAGRAGMGGGGSGIGGVAGVSGAAGAGVSGAAGVAGVAGVSGVAGVGGVGGVAGVGGADPSAAVPKNGLLYWYAGDRGLTEVMGVVSRWADQSGRAADAAQVVSASRPKRSTFNGLPVVDFDGIDDYLVMPQIDGDFSQGVSFFALALPNADSTCMGLVELSQGAEIEDVSFTNQSQTLSYEVLNQVMVSPIGGFATGEVRMVEVVQNDTSGAIWLDGVSSGLMDMVLPDTAARSQNFVGRSLYADCVTFSGQIMEVLFYARAVSDAERQTIESYLQAKWGCCKG